MEREKLGSRLGFILLSAGCAIGLGNVWKFPYITGQNGGAIFVLIYLFFLIIMGIPVMTMEFALGRASQKSPAKMYQELEPKGTKWHLHSYLAIAGNYLLMMFYTSVAGWLLKYFVDECNEGYGVFEIDEIKSFLPKKYTTNDIKRLLKHYDISGYISIKYSDEKTYCLSPLAKARALVEEKKSFKDYLIVLFVGLFAFLGAFLGTLFYNIIF